MAFQQREQPHAVKLQLIIKTFCVGANLDGSANRGSTHPSATLQIDSLDRIVHALSYGWTCYDVHSSMMCKYLDARSCS